MQPNFVVLDLEMTGLDAKRDKIIEIGAVRIKDGQTAETYQTFVNPGRRLGNEVKEITGIRDEELMDAPYIVDVMEDFLKFAGTDCLIGHRILFDYSFLKRAAVNQGYTFEREGIDTLRIARMCLRDLPSKSLPALCEHFGIQYKAHRALEDALATHRLYQMLCAQYEAQNAELFSPKKLICQVKKESPATKGQIRQIEKLLSYHKLTERYTDPASEDYVNLGRLTRNEASRLVDTIILHYGRCQ